MRRILAWLNRRFPEVLTVTKQDYTELRQEVSQLNIGLQAITELHNRLQAVEKQVTQLNNANGFIQTAKGSFKLER
jgi:hypothetical protein